MLLAQVQFAPSNPAPNPFPSRPIIQQVPEGGTIIGVLLIGVVLLSVVKKRITT